MSKKSVGASVKYTSCSKRTFQKTTMIPIHLKPISVLLKSFFKICKCRPWYLLFSFISSNLVYWTFFTVNWKDENEAKRGREWTILQWNFFPLQSKRVFFAHKLENLICTFLVEPISQSTKQLERHSFHLWIDSSMIALSLCFERKIGTSKWPLLRIFWIGFYMLTRRPINLIEKFSLILFSLIVSNFITGKIV